MRAPTVSSTSLAGLSLAACALPSATIDTSSPPDAHAASSGKRRKINRRPEVLDAELRGEGNHLHLQLSEPLAPLGAVDPNDFRLSLALAYAYPRYAYAYYYDLGMAMADRLMTITSMVAHGDTLELYLDPPVEMSYCAEIEQELQEMQEPGVRVEGGLFLHYAPGRAPISDLQGQAMSSFAAAWVLHEREGGEYVEELELEGLAARHALRDAVPIRCGAQPPPGPR